MPETKQRQRPSAHGAALGNALADLADKIAQRAPHLEMPDELRLLPVENVARAAIRATKSNISSAILARIKEKNDG